MNKYEAMIIFPDAIKDEALEAALEKVEAEIQKSGGKVESKTRMGRRQFARPMDKQNSGQYMVVNFKLDGAQLTALQHRFKLNEDIFRIQIVRASEIVAPPAEVAPASAGK